MKKIEIRTIKEPNLSGNFSISNLNTLLSEKDMIEQTHRHDFFFVLAIEKGNGEHQIDFTSYAILNYSVFILRPGQVHQLILKKESKGYLMAFDNSFYAPKEKLKKEMLSIVSRNNYYKLETEIYNRLIPILECILSEYSNKKIMFRDNIKANLDLFFIELFRQTKNSDTLTKNNSYDISTLEKLLKLLDIHFYKNKQVSYYANQLNLSTYQLNSITKKALGKSCSQLINERTLLEAKRYLVATSNQINEISYHLGYDDTSYFIRFFRKQTGLTPAIFRQSFK
ncbi:AraC family transcriptional regulator [uncultured Tenacibaculum sp.]|uniref:AraC family transcriptional regulator n=1 Tax=uncultured Tenacibaculum sp. TaxID=174713 RepID=UPI00260DD844|nr:AraC family transcriptional regulator [uncultured Tenacibaculum sp.]